MITYYAARETADEMASDEDRAMARVNIYQGDSLENARLALTEAMNQEIQTLLKPKSISSGSLRRAADIMEGMLEVPSMTPLPSIEWSWAEVTAGGIMWTIVMSHQP